MFTRFACSSLSRPLPWRPCLQSGQPHSCPPSDLCWCVLSIRFLLVHVSVVFLERVFHSARLLARGNSRLIFESRWAVPSPLNAMLAHLYAMRATSVEAFQFVWLSMTVIWRCWKLPLWCRMSLPWGLCTNSFLPTRNLVSVALRCAATNDRLTEVYDEAGDVHEEVMDSWCKCVRQGEGFSFLLIRLEFVEKMCEIARFERVRGAESIIWALIGARTEI